MNTVDPATGASAAIAGPSLPGVDGIALSDRRLFAVQNLGRIVELRLSPDLAPATVRRVITSDLLQVPTTVARFGRRLATVNATFDAGFPPTADRYEAVVVER